MKELIFFLIVVTIYFLPSIIGVGRNCKKQNGIIVLNIFLGWTLIGWVGSLVWSVSGEIK